MKKEYKKPKTSILLIATSLLIGAQHSYASSFQTNCSSANGKTLYTEGHYNNAIKVTQLLPEDNNLPSKTNTIELDPVKLNLITDNKIEIENSMNNSCDGSRPYGLVSFKSKYYKEIIITNKNGNKFSAGIIGLSTDRKEISAQLYCESFSESVVPCN